ncbi:Hypothetical predicted protein [Olea europaea subsp. europaea]|uniref:Uncharacterized protein n=1 Tax=Olea europaea subsp. europaea TaxID=158383 RepID=A0A8S0U4I0_OLEEU|nr:Hypothetical predicted protein [Olea europaea subsp. europaea]
MGRRKALFLLVVVACCALVAGVGGNEDEWGWEEEEGDEGSGEEGGAGRPEGVDWFLLQDSKQVVKTDAGKIRVVRWYSFSLIYMFGVLSNLSRTMLDMIDVN